MERHHLSAGQSDARPALSQVPQLTTPKKTVAHHPFMCSLLIQLCSTTASSRCYCSPFSQAYAFTS